MIFNNIINFFDSGWNFKKASVLLFFVFDAHDFYRIKIIDKFLKFSSFIASS